MGPDAEKKFLEYLKSYEAKHPNDIRYWCRAYWRVSSSGTHAKISNVSGIPLAKRFKAVFGKKVG